MSHIPASKMPHAKPHEHDEHAPAAEAASDASGDAASAPLTGGPEIKPAPAKGKPADAGASRTPYVAIAAVGAIAIGGIVAALALRRPEPPHKGGKSKTKGRGRKGRHAD